MKCVKAPIASNVQESRLRSPSHFMALRDNAKPLVYIGVVKAALAAAQQLVCDKEKRTTNGFSLCPLRINPAASMVSMPPCWLSVYQRAKSDSQFEEYARLLGFCGSRNSIYRSASTWASKTGPPTGVNPGWATGRDRTTRVGECAGLGICITRYR